MFLNLFFLLLVLFLINSAPQNGSIHYLYPPVPALVIGLFLYCCCLGILYAAGKFRKLKNLHIVFANLLLLTFFAIFYFFIGGHRLYTSLGSTFLDALIPVFLYLFALWFTFFLNMGKHRAEKQVQFILPFVFPFLLLSLFSDGFNLIFREAVHPVFLLIGSLIFLGLTIIFMPAILIRSWGSKKINDPALTAHLESICEKTHFKHAGMYVWSVFKEAYTAGIVGVIPRFRYVMFTPKLLKEFSLKEIEAVLIHEIGHNTYRHLLIYPFFIYGLFIFLAFFSYFFSDSLILYFGFRNYPFPSPLLETLLPIIFFIIYAFLIGIYFRVVFGFFSRMFERQADLHIFSTDAPPEQMVHALDHLGKAGGNIHRLPSWHHGSLSERIDFLKRSIHNPRLVRKHHLKVILYTSLFFIGLIFCTFIMFSWMFPDQQLLKPIAEISKHYQNSITAWTTQNQRVGISNDYIQKYQLKDPDGKVRDAIEKSYLSPESVLMPGFAEYQISLFLLESNQLKKSIFFMTLAWDKNIKNKEIDPKLLKQFSGLTETLIKKNFQSGNPYGKEIEKLKDTESSILNSL